MPTDPENQLNLAEVFQGSQKKEPDIQTGLAEPVKTAPPKIDITAAQRAELDRLAALDKKKRDFTEAVLAARQPKTPVNVVQPVAPRILEQTRLEMEAGRAAVAKAEAAKPQSRPQPQQDPGVTPVFRPADYVPKMNKGNVGGRTL